MLFYTATPHLKNAVTSSYPCVLKTLDASMAEHMRAKSVNDALLMAI
jgi:hypothetical protein